MSCHWRRKGEYIDIFVNICFYKPVYDYELCMILDIFVLS